MESTISWTPRAIDDLATIWLDRDDRDTVTAAVEAIDRPPNRSPEENGEHLFETVYSASVDPLGVDYEVAEPDRVALLLSACQAGEPGDV